LKMSFFSIPPRYWPSAAMSPVPTGWRQAKGGQCRLLISFMSRMDLLYCIWREEGEEAAREALRLIDCFAMEWVSCEPGILEIASRRAQARLSVADSWIGATAIAREATLIHRDPEFTKFKEIPQEPLRR
ncbi:PIN domain-containing protein, partial [Acidobacteria bacterium AH-259-L09]|nr:PIN domain-containing protein [Acidobacteria bacterium AH-259-L09]